MLSKTECKHKNLIKSGRHLYRNGFYQMYRCLDCGTTIKGELINKEGSPLSKDKGELHE